MGDCYVSPVCWWQKQDILNQIFDRKYVGDGIDLFMLMTNSETCGLRAKPMLMVYSTVNDNVKFKCRN